MSARHSLWSILLGTVRHCARQQIDYRDDDTLLRRWWWSCYMFGWRWHLWRWFVQVPSALSLAITVDDLSTPFLSSRHKKRREFKKQKRMELQWNQLFCVIYTTPRGKSVSSLRKVEVHICFWEQKALLTAKGTQKSGSLLAHRPK